MSADEWTPAESFALTASTGLEVLATRSRHTEDCWRYVLNAGEGTDIQRYVGDILFFPEDAEVLKLIEIKIQPNHRRTGIGTALLTRMLSEWRDAGFTRVEGVVVAAHPRFKVELVAWYRRFGGSVSRESDPENPRLAGRLVIPLGASRSIGLETD